MEIVIRSSHTPTDVETLMKYSGKSKSYVRSAIDAALLLGMIKKDEEGSYKTISECAELSINMLSEDSKLSIFKKWLTSWDPFITFVRHIGMGDSSEVSARRLTSFYTFNKEPKAISELLLLWAKTCDLIDSSGNLNVERYNIESGFSIEETSVVLTDDVSIRLYLNTFFGDQIFNWLTHSEIEELINAFVVYKGNPRNAIESSGRSFEDILRRLSLENPLVNLTKLSRKSGISELANNILYSYKDDSGANHSFIHTKQRDISQAIGSVRNMASHSMESKSMERWDLTPDGALSKILMTMVTVRSLFLYLKEGKFMF